MRRVGTLPRFSATKSNPDPWVSREKGVYKPSKELTYPTLGKGNHLQKCLGKEYVSSQDMYLGI